jgi:hypothetical protein
MARASVPATSVQAFATRSSRRSVPGQIVLIAIAVTLAIPYYLGDYLRDPSGPRPAIRGSMMLRPAG